MFLAAVTVGPNVRSHFLTDLASEMDYAVHVMASTVAGSKNGSDFNFKTSKYGMSFSLILYISYKILNDARFYCDFKQA